MKGIRFITEIRHVYFKFHLVILLLAGILNSSCKDELIFTDTTTTEQEIEANSYLANLMMRIAMKDGSADDFIDGASCISLELPATLSVGGIEIIIQSEGEYDLLKDEYETSEEDEDKPTIVFPARIVRADHTKVTVYTREEFDIIAGECASSEATDPDIECLDFVFPLTMTELDLINQRLEPFSVKNDAELFEVLNSMESGDLISMEMPIIVVLSDGTEAVLSDLIELEQVIQDNRDTCSEEDNAFHEDGKAQASEEEDDDEDDNEGDEDDDEDDEDEDDDEYDDDEDDEDDDEGDEDDDEDDDDDDDDDD